MPRNDQVTRQLILLRKLNQITAINPQNRIQQGQSRDLAASLHTAMRADVAIAFCKEA